MKDSETMALLHLVLSWDIAKVAIAANGEILSKHIGLYRIEKISLY